MSVYLKKVTIAIIIIYLIAIVFIRPSQFVPTKIYSAIRVGLLSNLVKIIFTLVNNYHIQYHLRSWIASSTNCASFSLLALRHHNKRENQRFKHWLLSKQENGIVRPSLHKQNNNNKNHTIIPSAPGCPTEPLSP